MPRPTISDRPMTPAERARRYRAKKRETDTRTKKQAHRDRLVEAYHAAPADVQKAFLIAIGEAPDPFEAIGIRKDWHRVAALLAEAGMTPADVAEDIGRPVAHVEAGLALSADAVLDTLHPHHKTALRIWDWSWNRSCQRGRYHAAPGEYPNRERVMGPPIKGPPV